MGSFKLKLVVYFALLALLPTAVAFYGFDTLAKRGETRAVDARLGVGLRAALAEYAARLDSAQEAAATLARDPAVQRALGDRDRAAAADIARAHPNVTLSTPAFTAGTAPGRSDALGDGAPRDEGHRPRHLVRPDRRRFPPPARARPSAFGSRRRGA